MTDVGFLIGLLAGAVYAYAARVFYLAVYYGSIESGHTEEAAELRGALAGVFWPVTFVFVWLYLAWYGVLVITSKFRKDKDRSYEG